MSEPIEVFNNHIINAGDMSASVTSDIVTLDTVTISNIQCAWTGTPTGTLVYGGRNDESMPWTTISSVSLAGSDGDCMFNQDVGGMKFVRIAYTRASGSGVLNSFANGKKRS